jgi:hypothetical protein
VLEVKLIWHCFAFHLCLGKQIPDHHTASAGRKDRNQWGGHWLGHLSPEFPSWLCLLGPSPYSGASGLVCPPTMRWAGWPQRFFQL